MTVTEMLITLAFRTLIPLVGITMLAYHLFDLTPQFAFALGVLGAGGTLMVHRLV